MDYHFYKGNIVQLLYIDKVGEIIAIHNGHATVNFDYVTLTVPLEKIKLVAAHNLSALTAPVSLPKGTTTNSLDMYKFLDFHPELDLHGLSIDEALRLLDKWIDQAILAGHRHLRIIHGKGKGLLRQEVHKYLKNHELINKVIVNHNLAGGSGVTLVEL